MAAGWRGARSKADEMTLTVGRMAQGDPAEEMPREID